jgi:hypothetical protein
MTLEARVVLRIADEETFAASMLADIPAPPPRAAGL